MKSLSSFNAYGDMAGTSSDPYGTTDALGSPVDYHGSPSSVAWYSYQAGLAGFAAHDHVQDEYGNIFKRVFTPRKWEEEKGQEEGTARLFSGGKSKAERAALRLSRKSKRAEKKSKRRGSQYRIVRIADGTRVKQDGNGVFTFVGKPKRGTYRHHKSGDTVSAGHHHYQELSADVIEAAGPFSPGASAADWAQLAKVGGGIGLDVLKIFKGAPPEDDFPDAPRGGPPMQASQGIPKQYLFIGGGVLGLVLLVALLKK
jgi:hypothetical protein